MLIYKEGSSEFLNECLFEIPFKVHTESAKKSIRNAIHALEVCGELNEMCCMGNLVEQTYNVIYNLADALEDVTELFPD